MDTVEIGIRKTLQCFLILSCEYEKEDMKDNIEHYRLEKWRITFPPALLFPPPVEFDEEDIEYYATLRPYPYGPYETLFSLITAFLGIYLLYEAVNFILQVQNWISIVVLIPGALFLLVGAYGSWKGAQLQYLTQKDIKNQKKHVVIAKVLRNVYEIHNKKFVYYLYLQTEGLNYRFCTKELPAPFYQGDTIEIHLSKYCQRILKIRGVHEYLI